MQPAGLRVTVVGELPDQIMASIRNAVTSAVLDELAQLAISPPLKQVPVTARVDHLVAAARSEDEPSQVIDVLAQLGLTDPTGRTLVAGWAGTQEPADPAGSAPDPR